MCEKYRNKIKIEFFSLLLFFDKHVCISYATAARYSFFDIDANRESQIYAHKNPLLIFSRQQFFVPIYV